MMQRYEAPNARYSKSHISPQPADITEVEPRSWLTPSVLRCHNKSKNGSQNFGWQSRRRCKLVSLRFQLEDRPFVHGYFLVNEPPRFFDCISPAIENDKFGLKTRSCTWELLLWHSRRTLFIPPIEEAAFTISWWEKNLFVLEEIESSHSRSALCSYSLFCKNNESRSLPS